jgi:hypothetical protein
MKWIDVQTPADWKLFHQVPRRVYRHDPNWIEPLHSDVAGVFDPRRNKAMEQGEARLLVVLNDSKEPVGRVASFIDPIRNREMGLRIGGIGFFECINDPDLAHALLDRAEKFLIERRVHVIDAIINFGERDKFWGLLTYGFAPPLYQEHYHPPYYRSFFEARNYLPNEQILTFRGNLDDVPANRLEAIARRARKRYGFSAKTLAQSNIQTFARHFAIVYNVAFADKPHFKPIPETNMYKLFKQLRPIADPNMVCIAYLGEQPIGFAGFIPDINPFLRKAKGKLNWLTLPGFFLRLKTTRIKPLKGIAFGIDPEYHGKGVFAVLTDFIYHQSTMTNYPHYYLAAIRAHNDIMVRSVKSLGVNIERIHLDMRRIIDPTISFEPNPFIEPE